MGHIPKDAMVKKVAASTGLPESAVVELIANISDRQKRAETRLKELEAQILQIQSDIVIWTATLEKANTSLAKLADEAPDPIEEAVEAEPVAEKPDGLG
jgi:outer membrane protein TolC